MSTKTASLKSVPVPPKPLATAARADIPAFRALDIMALAFELSAKGEDVLHLEAGQPSKGAPDAVVEEAIRAMENEHPGYTPPLGRMALRERIAQYYADYYGTDVAPERVAVTTGSSGGFLLSFLTFFEDGDKVALAAPGYPAYRNFLTALGLVPVELPTGPETRFQPTRPVLEQLDEEIDGLIIASPSNPAGSVIRPDELQGIVDWCAEHGVRIISDELYHGVTFEDKADTVLNYTQDAVAVNSFSKYFAMTGWRLGWLVLPENSVARIEDLAASLTIAPPTLPQYAAEHIFDNLHVLDGYAETYRTNRDILSEALPKLGFDLDVAADGAFYLYVGVRKLTNDSEAFCKRMLAETGVAMTPGTDFDPARGHNYVRISFAGATQNIRDAVDKLTAWLS